MTSESDDLYVLKGRDLENFGFASVRDLAYDAVQELWRKRKSEGWNQLQLAANIGRDPGWLSRYLKGPGNWTFRTFGAFVQGLGGEVEIRVRPREDIRKSRNENSYSGYLRDVDWKGSSSSSAPIDPFANKLPQAKAANSTVELR